MVNFKLPTYPRRSTMPGLYTNLESAVIVGYFKNNQKQYPEG